MKLERDLVARFTAPGTTFAPRLSRVGSFDLIVKQLSDLLAITRLEVEKPDTNADSWLSKTDFAC
jgi:hypothetical protein